ncbi:MAG: triose-phosphate isomerase [Candidatus Jacksonbacteria bacterium]|nr:triose-phosphate isomerase [Candidatus Jacksonbacteria bacterium]
MKYLIANWKMKLSPQDELALAKRIAKHVFDPNKLTVILAPTFLTLERIHAAIKTTPVLLAAQDCFWEDSGAYTGEISPSYLSSIGCTHVIIGHSERRIYLSETPKNINAKIIAVVDALLTPILCVGESAEERISGAKDHIVRRQIESALENVELVGGSAYRAGRQKLIIAYEPVWAIGTGHAAKAEEIVYMHQVIRQALIDIFPREVVDNNTAIFYGGSVDNKNIGEFIKEEIVQGALVGSASTKADEFFAVIDSMQKYA